MWCLRVCLCILWIGIFHVATPLPREILFGGIFDAGDTEKEVAFREAIRKVNLDATILREANLVPLVEHITLEERFQVTKKVCNLLEKGIAGIFGPQSHLISMHIQAVCDALDIPHVETRWDFQFQRDDLSINLFPHPSTLNRAYMELVRYWNWTSFSIVYEEAEAIIRLQDFLKESQRNDWKVMVYQFSPKENYRDLLWKIRKETRVILDVKNENILTVLKQAQQVGMMTEKHNYLITSLDFHTLDFEDFRYGRTNITGFRLVRTETQEYKELLTNLTAIETIKTETALIYDAVKLFATALQDLDDSKNITFPRISCDNGVRGSDGTSIINYMKPITISGLSGKVTFDSQGFRSSEFSLDVLYLTRGGIKQIGYWTPEKGIDITTHVIDDHDFEAIRNKTLIVTTVITAPYVMLKDSVETLSGNARYEGFCIDLIEELASRLKFNYILRQRPDSDYGKSTPEEGVPEDKWKWNGMIRELIDKEADLALIDMTVSAAREKVVDFTMPFMSTGIGILYRKSTTKVTTLFSFLSPFSTEVWIYVMGAYLGVSVMLFLVGRLSPYEWDNPHPCRQDDQVLENSYSLLNSMWFAIGSLLQQGSDIAPKAGSTRTIAGVWYFFTLVLVSSYTANLAAFLTIESSVDPFNNAEELIHQSVIQFGCKKSGSTRQFFEESTIDTYKKINEIMSRKENEHNLVDGNDDGVKRVLEGNYAYFMESASIEYQKERQCNLTAIGKNLDSKGYGIATQRGSAYRTILSRGILDLQEEGKLIELKEKWWKQKRGGGRCSEKKTSNVRELGLVNVGGVFVVLMVGLVMAIVVAVLEFFLHARKEKSPDKEPIPKQMFRELKFAVSCQSSSKTVPKKQDMQSNDLRMPSVPSQY